LVINVDDKKDLKKLNSKQLEEFILENDIEKYKAKIIWQWIYKKYVTDFNAMTNLSKRDREVLSEVAYISTHEIADKKTSGKSKTTKYVFKLEDGSLVESVFIPSIDHSTVCISSQVGCAQGCVFCATGAQGFKRNLKSHEIVEQVLAILREGKNVDYIVFMGMGEPLINIDNVIQSIRIINDPNSIGIGARKITVSTAGMIPNLIKLADSELGVNIAISLNATSNHVRSSLMPINEKYPIKKLMETAEYCQKKSGRRITFEYILLEGINDSEKDATDLSKLMKMLISHVNLIGFNPSPDLDPKFVPSTKVSNFKNILLKNEISVTVRHSTGQDIFGACGQLAGK